MANGTGLFSNFSTTQAACINIYYIFTASTGGQSPGLYYSIVDMNLAVGMGSITAKNTLLNPTSSEQLSATYHCNQTDIWVLGHESGNNNFCSFLVTASGVSITPVISSIGSNTSYLGYQKFSPNGKKVASPIGNGFALFDFNNLTGVLSNSATLTPTFMGAYGCEFSPNGTKLYGASQVNNSTKIVQWDLCSGGNGASAAPILLSPPPLPSRLLALCN